MHFYFLTILCIVVPTTFIPNLQMKKHIYENQVVDQDSQLWAWWLTPVIPSYMDS
jgi:hypothetical protein